MPGAVVRRSDGGTDPAHGLKALQDSRQEGSPVGTGGAGKRARRRHDNTPRMCDRFAVQVVGFEDVRQRAKLKRFAARIATGSFAPGLDDPPRFRRLAGTSVRQGIENVVGGLRKVGVRNRLGLDELNELLGKAGHRCRSSKWI